MLLLCAALGSGAEAARAWWNCGWESRVALQVSNAGGTQSNALVAVRYGSRELGRDGLTQVGELVGTGLTQQIDEARVRAERRACEGQDGVGHSPPFCT